MNKTSKGKDGEGKKRTYEQVEKWYDKFYDTNREAFFNIKWLIEEAVSKAEKRITKKDVYNWLLKHNKEIYYLLLNHSKQK